MSISSMTNVAVHRLSGKTLPEFRHIQAAAETEPSPQTDATAALKAVASYIPSEVLTVYVAALATLQGSTSVFWWFFGATPVVVWLVYAGKLASAGKPLPVWPGAWPWWEMFAATIAFVAWGLALPDSPFKSATWYSSAIAGLGVVTVSVALGLLAPVFTRGRASG
jgi:hypothetical protein